MFSTSKIKVENIPDDCGNFDGPDCSSSVDGAFSAANFIQVFLKTEDCASSSTEERPYQPFDAAESHEVCK